VEPRPHGLRAAPASARNDVIGRESTRTTSGAAPLSAHVKRVAQESFPAESFLLRRSMPGDVREHGFYFVAYAATLDPFERIRGTCRPDDGIGDALLRCRRRSRALLLVPAVAGKQLESARARV